MTAPAQTKVELQGIGALAGRTRAAWVVRVTGGGRELLLYCGDAPLGASLFIYFYADGGQGTRGVAGEDAGRQVGGGATGWMLPRSELDRARRALGLPPLRNPDEGEPR